jgi:probable rRNA maturation factor
VDVITVEVNNQQTAFTLEVDRLREAAKAVLAGEGIASAHLSLAVVDDATSHKLNRQFLQHDYPTDVLSFLLEEGEDHLEGEVVVSADTASRVSPHYNWKTEDELLLYVVHGVLHLAGYDDHGEQETIRMRQREEYYLKQFGLKPRYEEGEAETT